MWIQTIQSFVDNSSQLALAIIGTHFDQISTLDAEKHYAYLHKKYVEKNIAQHVVFMCATSSAAVNDIRNTILSLASRPSLKVKVTGSILFLQHLLSTMRKEQHRRTIGWSEFCDVAIRCGISPAAIDSTARLLHELGVFLSYRDFVRQDCKRLVVLDPEWLVDVMRSLINVRTQHIVKDGLMSRRQLETFWCMYPVETQQQMLLLLESFGILYVLNTPSSRRIDYASPVDSSSVTDPPRSTPSPNRSSEETVTPLVSPKNVNESVSSSEGTQTPVSPSSPANRPLSPLVSVLRLPSSVGTYNSSDESALLIPCLLPDESPDLRQLWLSERPPHRHSTFYRLFRFPFVPIGFVHRLQTKCLVWNYHAKVWRYGVYLMAGGKRTDPNNQQVCVCVF